ncbi:hypothetical protein CfE428DRAFT_0162 [Chthoniobacter flavus Ellin428]|uniref:Uncharacterized protein n=1 Tax=Chthoniobacter flavus Ellin428 TaxID=497964 RepID=B4CTZ9_9BACT|nr:hypothetical protein [Chthoniobacter flavus]EDY22037.1 hypothetical protein CfE428DRAFT_0162 [Chthoniobacter flavus Ellin428]
MKNGADGFTLGQDLELGLQMVIGAKRHHAGTRDPLHGRGADTAIAHHFATGFRQVIRQKRPQLSGGKIGDPPHLIDWLVTGPARNYNSHKLRTDFTCS